MKRNDLPSGTPQLLRAAQLISALFDERISTMELDELEQLMLSDSAICGLYVRMVHVHAGLYQYASALGTLPETDLSDPDPLQGNGAAAMSETMVVPALTTADWDDDLESPADEHFLPAPYSNPSPPVTRFGWIKGVAALLIIGLFTLLYVSRHLHSPAGRTIATSPPASTEWADADLPPVATVQHIAKPVWAGDFVLPAKGEFKLGQTLQLVSGAVELRLSKPGRLIVEGPASLQFVGYSKVILSHGKMVATVPGGGFTVQCPGGVVTDLGTEFGLDVNVNGATEVAVFQGSVAATPAGAAKARPADQTELATVLTVGQAATLSDKKIDRRAEGAIPQRFIRNLQSDNVNSLDVIDLVSGGDGTTHRRGIAIDSTDGEIGDLPPTGNRNGDGKYHLIQGYPVLDGTFIPDGAAGPMQINSVGDRFVFQTASHATHNLIETGGPIRWNDVSGISTVLSGTDYSTTGHGILCMHSNNGLTLDLNAVRRLHPDRNFDAFQCRLGNSYINGWHQAAKVNPIAGAFVLVDGNVRYAKPRFSNNDGSFVIDIPLSARDRFLTFATTDAQTDIDQQWILWTDAFLTLAPAR